MRRLVGYSCSPRDEAGVTLFTNDIVKSRCAVCGLPIAVDLTAISGTLKIRVASADALYTYDLKILYSKKFVDFVRDNSSTHFQSIQVSDSFYYILPVRELAFDAAAARTRFLKCCVSCGQFWEIIGATPAFTKDEVDADGIYATDLAFGTGPNRGPSHIVGLSLMSKLKKQEFRRLCFNEAYHDEA